jgi:putative signal transducing protein
MLQLYSARDSMDAHFLQGLLAEEGIEAVIQGEALEEVWGDLPLSQRTVPTLWIKESDLARAKPIVEEYERRRLNNVENGAAPARPTWKCPRCGEQIEEQFTACWHCNTKRPGTDDAAAV